MTVFANKKTFNSLGLEQVRQSNAHASQDCYLCLAPLALNTTKDKIPDSKCHTAIRIAACGHIIGKECLDVWLEVGHTCPRCNRLLFEVTGDPITQHDINSILHALGPDFGEDAVMMVVARLMARQEQEQARLSQAHKMEMEKMKAMEMQAKNDEFDLSEGDFLDTEDDMDFDEADDDEESEFEAGEDDENSI